MRMGEMKILTDRRHGSLEIWYWFNRMLEDWMRTSRLWPVRNHGMKDGITILMINTQRAFASSKLHLQLTIKSPSRIPLSLFPRSTHSRATNSEQDSDGSL